jgi:undecaprenyl-diphosphatase
MTIFQAAILGVIQGLTEFLPISSSGHLVIFQQLFGITEPPILFDVVVHVSTLFVVVVFFHHQLRQITFPTIRSILFATIPVVLVGLFLNSHLEVFFNSLTFVGIGLLVTTLLLFSTKSIEPQNQATAPNQPVSIKKALLIGLAQALAIFPGISRSGSTISIGLHQKLSRQTAFEFAFLLSIPAIIGALILQLITLDLTTQANHLSLITGFITAAPTGFLALTLLQKTLLNRKFHYFGFYCLFLALITLTYSLST